MAFRETRFDLVEFPARLRFPDLPLAIDDTSLAHHLGIRASTIWWVVHTKNDQYTVFNIKKRGSRASETRAIQHPYLRLKNIQRALLGRFLSVIPVGDHIGAYVPGRSCADTARKHTGKGVIISLDIKDFFPSVKRSMIRRYYNWVGYPHQVSSLLADLMTYKNFVPQGAPTSGYIANLVADLLFDRAIIKDLQKMDPRWCYTRYSDDIDISHPDVMPRETIDAVIDVVQKHVNAAGFRLNARKAKVEPRWRRQKVLGIVVNEKVNIPRVEYMRMRAIVHNCLMHGFDIEAERAGKGNKEALLAYIRGKINYFSQIDPGKAAKLRDQLEIAMGAHGQDTKLEADFDKAQN